MNAGKMKEISVLTDIPFVFFIKSEYIVLPLHKNNLRTRNEEQVCIGNRSQFGHRI